MLLPTQGGAGGCATPLADWAIVGRPLGGCSDEARSCAKFFTVSIVHRYGNVWHPQTAKPCHTFNYYLPELRKLVPAYRLQATG